MNQFTLTDIKMQISTTSVSLYVKQTKD